jgi:hypothetical protein
MNHKMTFSSIDQDGSVDEHIARLFEFLTVVLDLAIASWGMKKISDITDVEFQFWFALHGSVLIFKLKQAVPRVRADRANSREKAFILSSHLCIRLLAKGRFISQIIPAQHKMMEHLRIYLQCFISKLEVGLPFEKFYNSLLSLSLLVGWWPTVWVSWEPYRGRPSHVRLPVRPDDWPPCLAVIL